MAGSFIFMLAVIAGPVWTAKTDCGGYLSNTMKDGRINSPWFLNEIGRKVNCSWKFKPPVDGKNYVLQFSIRYHKLHYTADSWERECAAQLTMNGKLVKCAAKIYYAYTGANCSLYYNSSTCESTVRRLIENPATSDCKSFLVNHQSSFPIKLTYVSEGVKRLKTGFQAVYKFIECKQDSKKTTFSTTVATSAENKESGTPGMDREWVTSGKDHGWATPGMDHEWATPGKEHGWATPGKDHGWVTPGIDHEETTDPDLQSESATEGSASLLFTIIITLIAVIVCLLVGGIIGGIYFYRRLKSPANDRSQRQQPISNNNPLPGEEEVGQPSNAIPDVVFQYEEIKPPVTRHPQTSGYEVPQPTRMVEEDEAGYVVPNLSRHGESSREGEYAVVFQHLNPEYIEPETVPTEPNRRHGNLPANH